MSPHDRYPLVLLGLYGLVFVALGIAPADRAIWAAENLLVVIAIPIFILTYRNLRFSDLAYTTLFAFLVLHTVGSYFTYTGVPFPECFERNHYDRVVHFLYGLLIAPLAVELFAAKAPPRGIWTYLLPMLFLASHAAIFEVIEWTLVAWLMDPQMVEDYLCMQGDPWDAQKDMLLAMVGAAIGVAATMAMRRRSRPGPLPNARDR